MKTLFYYTIGYSTSYLSCLDLSIKSLRKYTDQDILILADEKLFELVSEIIPDVKCIACKNTSKSEDASMRKLDIFDYGLEEYDSVVYIDSDILIHMDIETVLPKITSPDKLYVYTESTNLENHTKSMWSLNSSTDNTWEMNGMLYGNFKSSYTESDLAFLKENKIMVFNAGLFAFRPTSTMKAHFDAVREMIKPSKIYQFYEQSYMNVYFNLSNATLRDLFTDENYIMFPDDSNYEGKIIHFCGNHGVGKKKYDLMKNYLDKYLR
jgi:alpha-N-acetylglucosamine transferase